MDQNKGEKVSFFNLIMLSIGLIESIAIIILTFLQINENNSKVLNIFLFFLVGLIGFIILGLIGYGIVLIFKMRVRRNLRLRLKERHELRLRRLIKYDSLVPIANDLKKVFDINDISVKVKEGAYFADHFAGLLIKIKPFKFNKKGKLDKTDYWIDTFLCRFSLGKSVEDGDYLNFLYSNNIIVKAISAEIQSISQFDEWQYSFEFLIDNNWKNITLTTKTNKESFCLIMFCLIKEDFVYVYNYDIFHESILRNRMH